MKTSALTPHLGRYHLCREIGRGFSSLVYEAQDTMRGRTVALKVLTLGQTLSDERRHDMAERFMREARAISALSHPGIVAIYEVGQSDDGRHFIAMEMLNGETLHARLSRESAMPSEEAVPIILQIADALQYAHERGIIHRDVKPDNIFIQPDGSAKLMDFGVAHILTEGALTQTGTVVGSPAYMSPEQISDQPLDGGSDVFSLGVTLAEMLTGHKPFDAPTIPAVMNRILHRPPQIERIQPRALHRVLDKALAKNPLVRYASAADFAVALRRQVVPLLPSLVSTSTMIVPPVASPRRNTRDSHYFLAALPAEKLSSRIALWTAAAACVAAAALPLLSHSDTKRPSKDAIPTVATRPAASDILIPERSITVTRLPNLWHRAPAVAPAVYVQPAHHTLNAPRTAPPVASITPPLDRPLLVMMPAAKAAPETRLAARPVLKTQPVPSAVVRVADSRQEQKPAASLSAPRYYVQETAPAERIADLPPRPQRRVAAVYPADLRDANITGSVVVRLAVNAQGRVTEATVTQSSGVDDLDAAALDAVGQWKYDPATHDSQPIPAVVTARIDFPSPAN